MIDHAVKEEDENVGVLVVGDDIKYVRWGGSSLQSKRRELEIQQVSRFIHSFAEPWYVELFTRHLDEWVGS